MALGRLARRAAAGHPHGLADGEGRADGVEAEGRVVRFEAWRSRAGLPPQHIFKYARKLKAIHVYRIPMMVLLFEGVGRPFLSVHLFG